MRILYVFHSLAYWGGIERILVDKMNYLASEYGYDIFMLTTGQGDHPIPYSLDPLVHLEDLNIRLHQRYQYHGLKRLLVNWKLTRLFKKRLTCQIIKLRPDVIVCTAASLLEIDIVTQLKGNIPLVIESHSICQQTIGQGGIRKMYDNYEYRRLLSKAQVLVALTEGDGLEWRQIHPNVKVIPNLVHQNDGKLSSLNNKRVIWVGRLDYQKRPLEIVEIWKKVYPQFPDWCLDIYGEGEQLQKLEYAVQQLDMNIHIHPPTTRIFDCYHESSILASTSLYESFGLVIVESMSCGLPVVAYNCPYGPADIIMDGFDGYLVENNNQSLFANRLCHMMSNISIRKKMGENAVNSAKQYSANNIMPMWNELFKKIVSYVEDEK